MFIQITVSSKTFFAKLTCVWLLFFMNCRDMYSQRIHYRKAFTASFAFKIFDFSSVPSLCTIELQRALDTIPAIVRIHLVKIVSFLTFPKHSKVLNAYSIKPVKKTESFNLYDTKNIFYAVFVKDLIIFLTLPTVFIAPLKVKKKYKFH